MTDLRAAIEKLTVDVRIQLLKSVSTTELVLVIAMAHLSHTRRLEKRRTPTVN